MHKGATYSPHRLVHDVSARERAQRYRAQSAQTRSKEQEFLVTGHVTSIVSRRLAAMATPRDAHLTGSLALWSKTRTSYACGAAPQA
jgi:hypothetical protein